MKKQFQQTSALQSAKAIAAVYCVASLPFLALVALSRQFHDGTSVAAWIVMPLAYAFGGFLGCLFGTSVYNTLTVRIGGVGFTPGDVETVSK